MLVDEAKYLAGKRVHESAGDPNKLFTWIGLIDPTEPELKIFQNRFHLNPLVDATRNLVNCRHLSVPHYRFAKLNFHPLDVR